MKIALIGCGAVTEHRHLPALVRRHDCAVVALVDHNHKRAQRLAVAAELGTPKVLTNYHDVLALGIDAAIVAVPNHLHAPVSCELLEAGIHVLVEKPMALSVAECHEMLEAARSGQAVLAVGLMRRFLHATRFTKWAVASGMLGRVLSFDIRDGIPFNWPLASDFSFRKAAAGGGVLIDTGPHTLDQLLWWLGDVASVEYYDNDYGGVESDCELYIELTSGAKGVVELSRTRHLRNTAIIQGDKAELEVELGKNVISLWFADAPVGIAGQGFPLTHPDLVTQTQIDLIATEHADWLEAIRHGYTPLVSGTEALKSVGLIESCYANRQPLHLPWM